VNYFSLLTVTGQAKIAAALQPGGPPLTITHIALGDGGGAAVVPSVHRAELINETHRQPVSVVEPDPNDPTQVRIQSVIPPSVGGFFIREIGLVDVDGDLVVYGNHPETAKPVLASGGGSELVIRTHFAVASTDAVTILIDPSIVNATQDWVQQTIAAYTPPISQVIDLQSALDGKADVGHTHHADDVNAGVLAVARIPALPTSRITGLDTALEGNTDLITDLEAALDGKADLAPGVIFLTKSRSTPCPAYWARPTLPPPPIPRCTPSPQTPWRASTSTCATAHAPATRRARAHRPCPVIGRNPHHPRQRRRHQRPRPRLRGDTVMGRYSSQSQTPRVKKQQVFTVSGIGGRGRLPYVSGMWRWRFRGGHHPDCPGDSAC